MIALPLAFVKDAPAALTCVDCGLCCLHMAVPPYLDNEVAVLIADHPQVYADYVAVRATRVLQRRVAGTDYIPCGFFDLVTRQCRHHAQKPDICVDFEVGGEDCLNLRTRAGL